MGEQLDSLCEAARYNDAQAEEMGLKESVRSIGLDFDALMHVAEQRALRAVMLANGRLDELRNLKAPSRINLSQIEVTKMRQLIPLYLDGIALGWRASKLSRDG